MVNLNIRDGIDRLLGKTKVNKDNNHVSYEEAYSILKEMKEKGETEREIVGVGKIYLNYEGDSPYVLYVPNNISDEQRLIVETNNCESDDYKNILEQVGGVIKNFFNSTNNSAPVLVPLLPSEKYKPYYQQLSRDIFYERDVNRVDDKVVSNIKEALNIIERDNGVKLDHKVFMHGYSSSGVFAQRFAILHPEFIDTLCVGGASLSIPFPSSEMDYPLGAGGIEPFNLEAYSKIKFRYYTGDKETINMAEPDPEDNYNDRKDYVDGDLKSVSRPMHDMTYFPRSVPSDVGVKYREKLGVGFFERLRNIEEVYTRRGLDFKSEIFKNRAHRNMRVDRKDYLGVNEKGDDFISQTYNESISSLVKESMVK